VERRSEPQPARAGVTPSPALISRSRRDAVGDFTDTLGHSGDERPLSPAPRPLCAVCSIDPRERERFWLSAA
jgi:hypothetical protein